MRKLTLVSVQTVALVASLLAATVSWAHTTEGDAKFGTQITLPGIINDVAVDELRRLVYAANFTAGRVDVVSMDTQQRISSFPTSPQPAATSGIAISPNRQWLVATSHPVTSGVPQQSSVTVVNLNDTSDRRHFAFTVQPLSVAFQANNKAVIITQTDLREFDPVDGSSKVLFTFENGVGSVILPIAPPTLPRSIVEANISSSADGRWVFGITPEFVFSYRVMNPVGLLRLRLTSSLVNAPVFNQVSGSPDGSHFMAGQLLLSNDLQVIADTPEADGTGTDFVGGTGFNPVTGELYASFGSFNDIIAGGDDNHPRRGIMQVLDNENLLVSSRVRLTERILGRIQPSGDGTYSYAVSESGLLYLPVSDLGGLPQLEVNAADRNLFFEFNFCSQFPITKTLRIESPEGSESAAFSLTTDAFRSSDRPGVLFEPHDGFTPADVQVTVDPGALGPVQGTNAIEIRIETNAVNVAQTALVITNVRDVDQKGTLHPVPGHLIQVLGDKFSDRFYVLDDLNFKVLVFDSNTMTQIAEFKTGNSPTWMTLSNDTAYLIVANSRGEHVSIIELNQLKSFGYAYMPWRLIGTGQYPYMLATDASRTILAARGGTGSKLHWLSLPARVLSTPETLGIFTNSFGSELAFATSANGDYVLIAESSGNVHLYETASKRIIISRSGLGSISGAIGAGSDFYMAGQFLLNASLVPLGQFDDATVNQQSSGFTIAEDGTGLRSIRPTSAVDTGVLQRIDPRDPTRVIGATRLAEPPPARNPGVNFSSTLSTLRDGRIVSTSSAGIVELPAAFDSGLGNPRVEAITNGADFSPNSATGGLISIFGDRFATTSAQASATPLPTELNGACVSANGQILPLLYVGPNQINAQLKYGLQGNTAVQVHTTDGISDIFVKDVRATAPAIFGVSGPSNTRFPAIFREDNTLATLSNPIRTN